MPTIGILFETGNDMDGFHDIDNVVDSSAFDTKVGGQFVKFDEGTSFVVVSACRGVAAEVHKALAEEAEGFVFAVDSMSFWGFNVE